MNGFCAENPDFARCFEGKGGGNAQKMGVDENGVSRMCKDFYTSYFRPILNGQNGATSIKLTPNELKK